MAIIDQADLAELRAMAEEQIAATGSTCHITRPGTGARTLDPVSLQYTGPADVTVYQGICKVQDGGQASTATRGDGSVSIDASTQLWRVDLPVAASTGVRQNDVVEITANPEDPALVTRKFTIRSLHHKSMATARRLQCTEGV